MPLYFLKRREKMTSIDETAPARGIDHDKTVRLSQVGLLIPSVEEYRRILRHGLQNRIDSEAVSRFLINNSWPEGLREVFLESCQQFLFRFILVDNTGSMLINDGRKIVGRDEKCKIVECSRWSELSDFLHFQARLSEAAKIPTEFRLINGDGKSIIVGTGLDQGRGLQDLLKYFSEAPHGSTNLCAQVNSLVATIRQLEPILREHGKKVYVMMTTHGEATDGNLIEALKPLQDLPVWLVIRLHTTNDAILQFWREVDCQLELDLDVISDVVIESQEVFQINPWLTYGHPLHQLRLLGSFYKEIDLIDEHRMPISEMTKLCRFILGSKLNISELPSNDPEALISLLSDYFKESPSIPNLAPASNSVYMIKSPAPSVRGITKGLSMSSPMASSNDSCRDFATWDPISKSMKYWIDLDKLSDSFRSVPASAEAPGPGSIVVGSQTCSLM